jgi:hypothetical protein
MDGAGFEYVPRNPEATVLYRVVAEHLQTFLRRQEERDGRFLSSLNASFGRSWSAVYRHMGFSAFIAIRADVIALLRFRARGACGVLHAAAANGGHRGTPRGSSASGRAGPPMGPLGAVRAALSHGL